MIGASFLVKEVRALGCPLVVVGGYPESASFLVKEVRLSAVWGQLAVSPGPASCQLEHLACGLRSVRARCHDATATAHVAW